MDSRDLSGTAVLVVDDHEDTTDLFADVLECEGAIVQRATSLLEALAACDAVPIRVAVTDLAMPNGSGVQLLVELRRRSPRMPVIAVTAQLLPGTPWLIRQGFAAVLYKPVDPTELVAVVAHLAAGGSG